MKKRIIIMIAAAALLLGGAAGAISLINRGGSAGVYHEYGRLEKEYREPDGSAVAISARSFSVTRRQVEKLAAELELAGSAPEAARSGAIEQLTEKYSLYSRAAAEGFTVTDDHVLSMIADMKKTYKNAENYEDFQAFLDGTGMGYDEYLDSQFDNLKIYETIAAFKRSYRERFAADDSNRGLSGAELDTAFEKYYDGLKADIVAAEQPVIS